LLKNHFEVFRLLRLFSNDLNYHLKQVSIGIDVTILATVRKFINNVLSHLLKLLF
jgi:hypothetical protein